MNNLKLATQVVSCNIYIHIKYDMLFLIIYYLENTLY